MLTIHTCQDMVCMLNYNVCDKPVAKTKVNHCMATFLPMACVFKAFRWRSCLLCVDLILATYSLSFNSSFCLDP